MVNIKMSSRVAGWWRGLIGGSGVGQSQAAARGGRRVAFELKSSYEAKSPRARLLTLRAFYDLANNTEVRENSFELLIFLCTVQKNNRKTYKAFISNIKCLHTIKLRKQ